MHACPLSKACAKLPDSDAITASMVVRGRLSGPIIVRNKVDGDRDSGRPFGWPSEAMAFVVGFTPVRDIG